MKEIIYLDTQLVNSLLAQLNKGLINKISKEDGSEENNSNISGKETEINASLDLLKNILLIGGVDIGASSKKTKQTQRETSKFNSKLVETVLDDYSLDLLLDNIQNENKIKNNNFILEEGTITSYNFEQIEKNSNLEDIKEYFPCNELFKNIITKHRITQNYSSYFKHKFPDSTIIKINNKVSICSNEYLRYSNSQLSYLNLGNRKAKLLGIEIAKIDSDPLNDLNKDTDFQSSTAIFNTILEINKIIIIKDYIIRPIAIYFEYDF